MRHNAQRQAVLVQSSPPGAAIFVDEKPVGRTPQYVEIKRSRRPLIEIADGEERIAVPMRSEYRWRDSFFTNLILLFYAPIGWGIDLLTETAWDADDPPVVTVAQVPEKPEKKQSLVAIAPPQAEAMALSDAGGEALQEALLRAGTDVEVKPYRDTLGLFLRHGQDFDTESVHARDGRDLYYQLGVDTVYESSIVEENGRWILRAWAKDAITQERTKENVELSLSPSTQAERIFTGKQFFQRLVPNALGLDLASDNFVVTRGPSSYTLTQAPSETFLGQAASYANTLNISSLPPRRIGLAGRWQFTFVPSLRVSYRRLNASEIPGLTDRIYTRWWLSGGYGPELGYQKSGHYFYVNFLPTGFWNDISWDDRGSRRSVTGTGISGQVEAGYLGFIDENWHARLFSRTLGEDANGWQEALGSGQPVGVNSLVTGLSLGYRFEPQISARRWRMRR